MPNTYNSYHTVAEQIINYNNNVVQILEQINSLATTTQATLNLTITDSAGNLQYVSVPSFSNLLNQIKILTNNVNTLYGLNNNGSIIQTGPNSFQRIITVDLNLEPADISGLSIPTNFVSERNYIVDNLMDPELFINIDLTGKIDNDTREILYIKYLIGFETDINGNLTSAGNSALSSFNSTYNGQTNIVLNDFLIWQSTTPGILLPGNPEYKQETIQLNPNQLQYSGLFTVLKAAIDNNNILWYYFNTLDYTDLLSGLTKTLALGDSLIINTVNSNTIYQVVNISTSASDFRVQLTAVTGNQPVPINIINGLKFYSVILTDRSVNIPIGYNEYAVIFLKSLNTTNNIISKNWSSGIAFWSNNLNLISSDNYNGLSMLQYYNSVVTDYGSALEDLVNKNVPLREGITPTAPILNVNNFQVVQTNLHLTNSQNINVLKSQASQVAQLDSQLTQISAAIESKNKQIQVTRFTTPADRQKANNDLINLQSKYNMVAAQKTSINNQILASSNTAPNVTPEYAVRGFWTIPAPVVPTFSNASQAVGKPQQIVKFDVEYKLLSADGSETAPLTFKLYDTSVNTNSSSTAIFSNWQNLPTIAAERTFDDSTNTFSWVIPDQNNAGNIDINQLSIPILPNETVQIRIRSISEVGFPDSPLYSDWSNIISISFPNSLLNSYENAQNIITNSMIDNAKNDVLQTLNNQGLNQLLSQKTTVNNNTYFLNTDVILSGFKDSSGNAIDLYQYLTNLANTISDLQAQISKAQGTLKITLYRNNTAYDIPINSTNKQLSTFIINCEDYCTEYTAPGVPSGRVYANNIYIIKDFFINISNITPNTSLGLLSNLTYLNNSSTIYNPTVPQVFWVDDTDNLITNDTSGISQTQLDNQFFWNINFGSVNSTSVTAYSQDIGNSFIANNSNSITNVLSSTQYNLGFAQNSILQFVNNNKSLLDTTKWIDTSSSVSSQNKLLTTIHPVVAELTDLVDTSYQSSGKYVHNLTTVNTVTVPINIYFKMNALDNTKTGANYQYINLNGVTQNQTHTKYLKFYLQIDSASQPIQFTLTFRFNRINTTGIKNNIPVAGSPLLNVVNPGIVSGL
jgi:hypothetical protein